MNRILYAPRILSSMSALKDTTLVDGIFCSSLLGVRVAWNSEKSVVCVLGGGLASACPSLARRCDDQRLIHHSIEVVGDAWGYVGAL